MRAGELSILIAAVLEHVQATQSDAQVQGAAVSPSSRTRA